MKGRVELLIFLIVFLLACFACKKEKPIPSIPNFTVEATPGIKDAEIKWFPVSNDTGIVYSIYLDNVPVQQNIRSRSFMLKNLQEKTFYAGKVMASDRLNTIKEVVFSFYTLEAKAPANFQLFTNAVTSDSISVSWASPADPQDSKVSFEVTVNSQEVLKDQEKPGLTLGNLDPQTFYHIEVIAKNAYNKSTSSFLNFTTLPKGDAKLIHRNILSQGLEREYSYYLPSGISNTNAPLLIYLHGAGGVAWPELITSQLKDIAEREKFIVAMPQALLGTTPDGTYLQWNAHEVLAWDDVLFLTNMIDTLCSKYTINSNRIYLCGMSNGGFMTFYTASRSNRFAAIAPMSGLMTNNIYVKYKANWPLPLLYIHGTADNIVPYNGAAYMPSVEKILEFWIRANACDTTSTVAQLPDKAPNDGSTVTLFTYEGKTPESEIRFYRINGGGHAIAGYEPGANQDFKAFEAIWDFFKTKSR